MLKKQMPNKNIDVDIVIIGSGLVGASLACALPAAYRVAIIDIAPVRKQESAPQYDDRVLALALGTQQWLARWNVWDSVAAEAQVINAVHVSERGQWGNSHLSADTLEQPALGYTVAAKRLAAVIQQKMLARDKLTLLAPAQVTQVNVNQAEVELTIQHTGQTYQLRGQLLIAADGGHSQVARMLHMAYDRYEYGQSAILANISISADHQGIAYERFTETGPLALLPLKGKRCALIWTLPSRQARQQRALSDTDFLHNVQKQFGWRLGRLQAVGQRSVQVLSQHIIKPSSVQRTLFLGNAAHSLHPVAGQGFNLGLRDVASLATYLEAVPRDPGRICHLRTYQQQRQRDQKQTQLLTHGLLDIFKQQTALVRWGRNAGMLALDHFPTAQRFLMRQLAGLK